MKSWFRNKWNKGKMLAELKPALFLSLTFCFMIFIYAPLEFYINNSNEFWYDAYLLFPFILKDFFLLFVISLIGFTVAYFIAKIVYEIALYGYFACMIACYIQGNFMIKNLPPLDGTEINWTLYRTETMKSTIMWIAVAVICLIGFFLLKYDMNNVNIKAKYFHSLKVMEIAKELANGLGIFDEEEISVIELIGLFHEIGNFSLTPNYHIDDDIDDAYDKTINILFTKGLIREISKETKYDNIIKMALYAYDKDGFPSDVGEKEKHICAIIKDAHNLDSFRLFVNYPYVDTRIDAYPNNLVYDEFKKFHTISPKMSENSSDTVLVVLSKMYSFNYRYSYYLLRKNNYITKMMDSLTFDNKEIENFFKQIMGVLNNYIDGKIGAYNA